MDTIFHMYAYNIGEISLQKIPEVDLLDRR